MKRASFAGAVNFSPTLSSSLLPFCFKVTSFLILALDSENDKTKY